MALVVKNLPCQCGRCKRLEFISWVGKIPWRRARQPTSVFLPRESPWTEEPGGLQFIGSWRLRHDWNNSKHALGDSVRLFSTQRRPLLEMQILGHESVWNWGGPCGILLGTNPFHSPSPHSYLEGIGFIQPPWPSLSFRGKIQAVIH